MKEKRFGKISKKMIAITAVILLLVTAVITPAAAIIIRAHEYNTPVELDIAELSGRTIKYQGRTYYLMCEYASLFDFERDEKIGQDGVVFPKSYYTLKNDENKNFLNVTELHESYLYSTIPIDYDYFSKPTNPKEIQLTIDDSVITIDNKDSIEDFYLLTYYHSNIKTEYNPDECTIIKSRIIPNDKLAVSYRYQDDAFIYNGSEWLIMGEVEYGNNMEATYYAYELDDAKMRTAFENIGTKYFPELFYETYDYGRYFVIPDESVHTDPSMDYIAD
ncbi:MAG: hypothetical protein J1E36_01995 [Eubacterium sp.]|nr:hypothetical protein [Eubacterium sp.]